jgi:hypothetical protein
MAEHPRQPSGTPRSMDCRGNPIVRCQSLIGASATRLLLQLPAAASLRALGLEFKGC